VLEFHILIHFLLEQSINLGCGKSLRLQQLEERSHKGQKAESHPYEASFALKAPRAWVEGVPTLMQFGRISNATETMIPVTSKPPLPVVSSPLRTYCQIYRTLHATGKHDGVPQRLPYQCVCVEVACSDRRDGHQRARAQLARKGNMGRLTLCIEHLPFPGRLWAIIDGDKFLRSTRSSHKCQFAAPRHCAIPRRACYVRSMHQGWHLSADNIGTCWGRKFGYK
jgi:hypothetical protein